MRQKDKIEVSLAYEVNFKFVQLDWKIPNWTVL